MTNHESLYKRAEEAQREAAALCRSMVSKTAVSYDLGTACAELIEPKITKE